MKHQSCYFLLALACLFAINFNLSAQAPPLLTLTMASSPSSYGFVTPTTTQLPAGMQVTLNATANSGYRFQKWIETTIPSSPVTYTSNPLTITMTSNRTFTGYFEIIPTYTLTTSVNGQGTVAANPVKTSYYEGESVTLTATPTEGYSFTGWSGSITGTVNPANIVMNQNKSVTANFAATPSTWQKNGTKVFYSAGNVGVGTLNPVSNLSLGMGSLNKIAAFENTTKQPGYGFAGIAAWQAPNPEYAEALGLWGGGASLPTKNNMHVIIKFDGKVGIGTYDPKEKLHVVGNTYISNASIGRSGTQYDEFGYNLGFSSVNDKYIYKTSDYAASIRMGNNGSIEFRTAPSGTAGSQFTMTECMRITSTGNVGIGCTNPVAKLAVNGKIQATSIEVKSTPCSDFVFYKDYDLMSLYDLEQFIGENKHLPGISSAKEFEQIGGYDLTEMDDLLLRKIEELTLYVIELKKENDALRKRIEMSEQ